MRNEGPPPVARTVRVVVTGATGQVAYALLPRIAAGEMFGPDTEVDLRLADIPQVIEKAKGTLMELEDGAYPLLSRVSAGADRAETFKDVDWALLVGSVPRGPGMERGDLIRRNGPIFVEDGGAIRDHATTGVRVAVVGNPCNTNCLIARHAAGAKVPDDRWSAMTRLDHNRARALLAKQAKARVSDVRKLAIWGNHSATLYPDFTNAEVDGKPAATVVDRRWLEDEFITLVQQRGAAIIAARGASSAFSAAQALIDHVRSLGPPRPGVVVGRPGAALGLVGVVGTVGAPPRPGSSFDFPWTACCTSIARWIPCCAASGRRPARACSLAMCSALFAAARAMAASRACVAGSCNTRASIASTRPTAARYSSVAGFSAAGRRAIAVSRSAMRRSDWVTSVSRRATSSVASATCVSSTARLRPNAGSPGRLDAAADPPAAASSASATTAASTGRSAATPKSERRPGTSCTGAARSDARSPRRSAGGALRRRCRAMSRAKSSSSPSRGSVIARSLRHAGSREAR